MGTKTPYRDENKGVYDREPSGDASDPRGPGPDKLTEPGKNPSGDGGTDSPSRSGLLDREQEGGVGSTGNVDPMEAALSAGSALAGAATGGIVSRLNALRLKLSNSSNKKKAGGAAAGISVTVGLLVGGGMVSGPLQVLQFGEKLDDHFASNEDSGNSRTSKILLYALIGKGAQNGRLGIGGNIAANAWEKKLLKDTGLRPVYAEPTRRFVGYEIVDRDKAARFLGYSNQKPGGKLEQTMGKGAEFTTGSSTQDRNDTPLRLANADGPVAGNAEIVSLARQNLGERRKANRAISKQTQVHGVGQAIAARLLERRLGVKFHYMNKAKQRADESAARRDQRKQEEKKQREREVIEGAKSTDDVRVGNTQDTDNDGEPDAPQPGDEEVSSETKSYIRDFKNSGALKTAKGPAIVVAVMCAARSYSSQIDEYSYLQVMVPMSRIGFEPLSAADQIRSLDDFDLESLRKIHEYMYDEKENTSHTQAESVMRENGKAGGTPAPDTADFSKGTKLGVFEKLDTVFNSIPGLGFTCGAIDTIMGLPIIKEVSNVVSDATTASMDLVLNRFGTSTDELLEDSLRVASGKSVNPLAEGAEYGHYANAGVFYASAEQCITMGCRPLTEAERLETAAIMESDAELEWQSRPLYARMFDPRSTRSLTGAIVSHSPTSFSQAAHMASNPIRVIGSAFASSFSALIPKADAQVTPYNYGIPKYGFSAAELGSDKFENPYENAVIVEPKIGELNDKYGNKCFGMTIRIDDGGNDRPHIEAGDSGINVFKVAKDSDCNETNKDEMFARYRFYLADTLMMVSLLCYGGDDDACTEVGFAGSTSGNEPEDPDTGEGEVSGVECPENALKTQKVGSTTYYQMPVAPDGEYIFDPGAVPAQRYGKKELVCVIYTVSKAYKEKYGNRSTVKVGDLNASGHASHKWGIAVDINAKGTIAAADRLDGNYDREATIALGKLFIDTGKVKDIWWCPTDDTITVLKNYASEKRVPLNIQCISGHEHHFHVNITGKKGSVSTP